MENFLGDISRSVQLSDDINRLLEIRTNPHSGRGVITKIDCSENQLVFLEEPLVLGPSNDPTSEFCCVLCYKILGPTTYNQCESCSLPICSEKCLNQSSGIWHLRMECPLLAKSRSSISAQVLFSTRSWLAPVRALILKLIDKPKWGQLLQLEHHPIERRNCAILQRQQALVWFAIQQLAVVETTQEEIRQVCGIFDSNAFRFGVSREIRALFTLLSLINHDCRPSTRVIFDTQLKARLSARRKIRSGEELTITYVSPLLNTRERREKLQRSKHFTCTCTRCEDPTEFGTHFSSLRCPKCVEGHLVDNDLPSCDNCSFKTTKEKVQCLMTALSLKQEKALRKSDSTSLENILGIYLKALSDNHSLVIDLKQKLLSNLNRENKLQTWKRRLQLNQEVINLLDRIDGSNSRQMGFLQYQRQRFFVIKLAHMQRVKTTCQNGVQESEEYERTDWLIGELEKSLSLATKLLKHDINCPDELKRHQVK